MNTTMIFIQRSPAVLLFKPGVRGPVLGYNKAGFLGYCNGGTKHIAACGGRGTSRSEIINPFGLTVLLWEILRAKVVEVLIFLQCGAAEKWEWVRGGGTGRWRFLCREGQHRWVRVSAFTPDDILRV